MLDGHVVFVVVVLLAVRVVVVVRRGSRIVGLDSCIGNGNDRVRRRDRSLVPGTRTGTAAHRANVGIVRLVRRLSTQRSQRLRNVRLFFGPVVAHPVGRRGRRDGDWTSGNGWLSCTVTGIDYTKYSSREREKEGIVERRNKESKHK